MQTGDMQSEIKVLFGRLEDEPEHRKELCTEIQRRVQAVRASGLALTPQIQEIERAVTRDCCAESQGR